MKEKVYLVFYSSRGSKELVFVASFLSGAVAFVSGYLSSVFTPDYGGPKCTFRVYEQFIDYDVYLRDSSLFSSVNSSTLLVYVADTTGKSRFLHGKSAEL